MKTLSLPKYQLDDIIADLRKEIQDSTDDESCRIYLDDIEMDDYYMSFSVDFSCSEHSDIQRFDWGWDETDHWFELESIDGMEVDICDDDNNLYALSDEDYDYIIEKISKH